MGKPATRSMHESSLQHKDRWVMPEIKGLQHLQDALLRDAAKQRRKYGGGEPTGDSAAFSVKLPQGSQHDKYCLPTRAGDPPASARQLRALEEPHNLISASPRPSSFDVGSSSSR